MALEGGSCDVNLGTHTGPRSCIALALQDTPAIAPRLRLHHKPRPAKAQ